MLIDELHGSQDCCGHRQTPLHSGPVDAMKESSNSQSRKHYVSAQLEKVT